MKKKDQLKPWNMSPWKMVALKPYIYVGYLLVVEPPLWKIWVRLLGWLFPIIPNISGKIKVMFQTTNQISSWKRRISFSKPKAASVVPLFKCCSHGDWMRWLRTAQGVSGKTRESLAASLAFTRDRTQQHSNYPYAPCMEYLPTFTA